MKRLIGLSILIFLSIIAGMLIFYRGYNRQKEISQFLPKSTTMLCTISSPANLWQKISNNPTLPIYKRLNSQLKKLFGVNSIDEIDKNSGINFEEPMGIAFIDFSEKIVAIFVSIEDHKKFLKCLENKIFADRFQLETKIANLSCMIVGNPEKPAGIYCFYQGYWIFYSWGNCTSPKSLEKRFQEDILSDKDRLADQHDFSEPLGHMEKGDGHFYINIHEIIKKESFKNSFYKSDHAGLFR